MTRSSRIDKPRTGELILFQAGGNEIAVPGIELEPVLDEIEEWRNGAGAAPIIGHAMNDFLREHGRLK